MKEYFFVILTIILILLFYLRLPDLDKTFTHRKKTSPSNSRRIDKTDLIIMAVIVLIFSVVDFWALGNTHSPQSFELMDGKTAEIELISDTTPNTIMFFSGVGVGQYDISCSEDGTDYKPVGTYDQNYVSVLKWEEFVPTYINEARFFHIEYSGSGGYMGEIVFLDDEKNVLEYKCNIPALNDEQGLAVPKQTFMNSTFFDEIYHARTAWEHINKVYPYEVSHPPLGKLIIALGISIFGMTPFGWRFSGTLFGVLMLPVIYIFSKKLFSDRRISLCCALLAGTDFMHYVQTRIATIDTYAVFFILLMYLFMYEYIETHSLCALALCGITFGLGAASKWTCFYAGAGLCVIWVADRIIHRKDGFNALLQNALFCIVFFVIIPCIIYYLSYIPYGLAKGITPVFSKEYFRTVIDNQDFMFRYHSRLVAEHPYSSVWYQWLLDLRPILYYLDTSPEGLRSEFGAFANPVLCWGGLIAMILILFCAALYKDKKAWFIIAAYSAQLLPWIFITRLTFEYHYFPCCMFLTLAMGYIFSLMKDGTKHWKSCIYFFTALASAVFVLFYPILSGKWIDPSFSLRYLKWLPSWPF